ncbi:Pup--protein ligase [Glutamicibacter halophytocola]|uniref:Pup--protein ligase n=1 Tax=Glutamicibacter halophytocola TaxID=1933880 RepID=A0ABX5Y829_9MICC|nr:Pup--protein ligase [Glutamicibacter halophytocola]MBF6671702.1 Pup--protein ligase [Glutamicibacter sp. FBE19]NQD40133.1 Pup--protein ligase [Glutamicibacter halophytocola]QDY65255.1 Pup--protein ligase [Glutamicibacter halophytocola]
MDRRIYGLETEFGLTYVPSDGRRLTPEDAARHLFKPVVNWGRSSNVFLENGSRLYLDVGSHPEYATAECDQLKQLIAHDRAGEAFMLDLVDQAEDQLLEEGHEGRIYMFKNNVDSAGNSYGCHENYLIPRKIEFKRLADMLIPFLVTRQLLCGAGHLIAEDDQTKFVFSQRADHMWEGVSSATTRSRPIINTRDEPHADAEYHRRLHVIVGDSSMSETTQLLKIGATDLVLRLIESGEIYHDLRLENPIRSIRQISHDFNGQTTVRLMGGDEPTALQIQWILLESVKEFVARHGAHHDQVERVLELWERTLTAIESGNYSLIDQDIDWAIKHKLIHGYAQKNSLPLSSPRLAQLNLTYHDIDPARGLFHVLKRRGLASSVVSDADIREAVNNPPATTRAAIRSKFIRAARAHGRRYSADWVHMKYEDEPGGIVLCKDPFATSDPEVDKLIDLMSQRS